MSQIGRCSHDHNRNLATAYSVGQESQYSFRFISFWPENFDYYRREVPEIMHMQERQKI